MVSILRKQDHARAVKKLKRIQRKKDKIEKKEFIRIVNVNIKEAIDSNRNYCEVLTVYFDRKEGLDLIKNAGYSARVNDENERYPEIFEISWSKSSKKMTMSQICCELGENIWIKDS